MSDLDRLVVRAVDKKKSLCTADGVGGLQLSLDFSGATQNPFDNATLNSDSTSELNLRARDVLLGGGFSGGNYWSSSENNNNNAWNQEFSSGSANNNNNNNKNNTLGVRCVRSLSSTDSTHRAINNFPCQGEITMLELFEAYFSCRKNKRNKLDALSFELNLERNLFDLFDEIKKSEYRLSPSTVFVVTSPKPREIWAAQFRDRIVHHLIYNRLAPTWFPCFINETYACIPGRGIHAAVERAEKYSRQLTSHWTEDAVYIKLDVANFFASIDKRVLFDKLAPSLNHPEIESLVRIILFDERRNEAIFNCSIKTLAAVPRHKSLFHAHPMKGLPIGNLSSQFFANVYLSSMDHYAKENLRIKHYIRYVDDVVIFGVKKDLSELRMNAEKLNEFLGVELLQKLNPTKTKEGSLFQGLDFLGFYLLPGRRYVRHDTYRRIERRIAKLKLHSSNCDFAASVAAYNGIFSKSSSRLPV